jgi:nucleoid-associated protein YgaU
MMSIAKRLTGSSNNYRAIANQNGIKNANKISVGQKLVIKA